MKSVFITLISSDNKKVDVDKKGALMSHLLKEMISNSKSKDEPIPIPEIRFDILNKVAEYLNYYSNKMPKEIPKPIPSANLDDFISQWDVSFINTIQLDNLYDMINAAGYLDIPSLLNLCCAKIASLMKGKTAKELITQYNLDCGLNEEEMKAYDEQ